MDFQWNITPEALAAATPPRDEAAEAAAQAAKLQAELAALTLNAPEPVETSVEPEPVAPSESQEPLAPSQEVIERVYWVQATHGEVIDRLAEAVLNVFVRVTDADLRACAIGRALAALDTDPAVVNASWSLESQAMPQRGDRVREENGAIGTVVSVRSLKEVIVKWDHVPRAMRTLVKYLRPAEAESDE